MLSFDSSWRQEAACKDSDTSLFFPHSVTRGNVGKIKDVFALCESCPVSHHCLHEAIVEDYDGIWGRTTRQQRQAFYSSNPNYTVQDCKDFIDANTLANHIPYTRSRRVSVNTNS